MTACSWRRLPAVLAVFIALGFAAIACGPSQAEPQGEPPEKQAVEATEQAWQATAEAGPHAPKPKHPELTPIVTPRPTPTPFVAGPEVRPCTASDLNAAVSRPSAVTGGELLAGIGFGNKSKDSCRLGGPPTIKLLDSGGGVIPLDIFQSPLCSTTVSFPCIFPAPLLMLPNLGELKPYSAIPGQAGLEITWWVHDGTGFCSPPPPVATAIRLLLPEGGGELTVDLTPEFPEGIAPCHSRVGTFAFSGVPPEA